MHKKRRTRVTLHAGSIIQSVTGSWHKVDTTHMSPEISFMHNLHKTMGEYDIDFVLSSRVYNLIPECMKFECRLIDVLKFSVSSRAQNVYCMDISLEGFQRTINEPNHQNDSVVKDVFEKRRVHMSIKSAIIERLNEGAKNTLFLEDEELKKMLQRDNEFRRNYRKGVNFYIIGA